MFSCKVVFSSSAMPWTVVHQASLSMGFDRQEYWSGLTFSSLWDIPDLGIKPISPSLVGRFVAIEPPEKLLWSNSDKIISCASELHWKLCRIPQSCSTGFGTKQSEVQIQLHHFLLILSWAVSSTSPPQA